MRVSSKMMLGVKLTVCLPVRVSLQKHEEQLAARTLFWAVGNLRLFLSAVVCIAR